MDIESRLREVGAFGIKKGGNEVLPDGMLAIDPSDLDSVLTIFAVIPDDVLANAIAAWLRSDE